MTAHFDIGEIKVEVIQKDIKNVHLSVYPPDGRVKIAAPYRMDLDTIRIFAISKLAWIRKMQVKILSQDRETPREYRNRESHYFLGKRYLLKVKEKEARPTVTLKYDKIQLQVRPETDAVQKQTILQEWYRAELKKLLPNMIARWEKKMDLQVAEFGIRRMKTKWGTCNPGAKRIWINLELAKKPLGCLEYIVVHEMVHLLERSHNQRFVAYMDSFLPQWRELKEELNRLPVAHVDWRY
jgi:predicted metal-dependent hydrolase